MGFEKGNNLWQRGENPGRPKTYEPDTLWDKAVAYFNWCLANPMEIEELGGKNFTTATREVSHPPTILEFCVFANISTSTWYLYAKKPVYSDICSHISNIMFSHNLKGAMVGSYNANIVARYLGLVDKKEVETNVNNVVLLVPSNGRTIAAPPTVKDLVEGEDFLQLPPIDAPLL